MIRPKLRSLEEDLELAQAGRLDTTATRVVRADRGGPSGDDAEHDQGISAGLKGGEQEQGLEGELGRRARKDVVSLGEEEGGGGGRAAGGRIGGAGKTVRFDLPEDELNRDEEPDEEVAKRLEREDWKKSVPGILRGINERETAPESLFLGQRASAAPPSGFPSPFQAPTIDARDTTSGATSGTSQTQRSGRGKVSLFKQRMLEQRGESAEDFAKGRVSKQSSNKAEPTQAGTPAPFDLQQSSGPQDNDRLIAQMTDADREAAIADLYARFDPSLLDKLRDVNLGGVDSTDEEEAPSKASIATQAAEQPIDTKDLSWIRTEEQLDEAVNHLPLFEKEKLRWTGRIRESAEEAAAGTGLPEDRALTAIKQMIGDESYQPSFQTARFDLDGNFVGPEAEVEPQLGLHHHGDDPEKAGYTMAELTHLARSKAAPQRSMALHSLAGLLLNRQLCLYARGSRFEQERERHLVGGRHPIFALPRELPIALRLGLDSKHAGVVSAALEALEAFLVPLVFLDELQGLSSISRGRFLPDKVPRAQGDPALYAPAMDEPKGPDRPARTREQQEDEDNELDIDRLERSPVEGLVRMGLVHRLVFLLGCNPSITTGVKLTSPDRVCAARILAYVVCHSDENAQAITQNRLLMGFIVQRLVAAAGALTMVGEGRLEASVAEEVETEASAWSLVLLVAFLSRREVVTGLEPVLCEALLPALAHFAVAHSSSGEGSSAGDDDDPSLGANARAILRVMVQFGCFDLSRVSEIWAALIAQARGTARAAALMLLYCPESCSRDKPGVLAYVAQTLAADTTFCCKGFRDMVAFATGMVREHEGAKLRRLKTAEGDVQTFEEDNPKLQLWLAQFVGNGSDTADIAAQDEQAGDAALQEVVTSCIRALNYWIKTLDGKAGDSDYDATRLDHVLVGLDLVVAACTANPTLRAQCHQLLLPSLPLWRALLRNRGQVLLKESSPESICLQRVWTALRVQLATVLGTTFGNVGHDQQTVSQYRALLCSLVPTLVPQQTAQEWVVNQIVGGLLHPRLELLESHRSGSSPTALLQVLRDSLGGQQALWASFAATERPNEAWIRGDRPNLLSLRIGFSRTRIGVSRASAKLQAAFISKWKQARSAWSLLPILAAVREEDARMVDQSLGVTVRLVRDGAVFPEDVIITLTRFFADNDNSFMFELEDAFVELLNLSLGLLFRPGKARSDGFELLASAGGRREGLILLWKQLVVSFNERLNGHAAASGLLLLMLQLDSPAELRQFLWTELFGANLLRLVEPHVGLPELQATDRYAGGSSDQDEEKDETTLQCLTRCLCERAVTATNNPFLFDVVARILAKYLWAERNSWNRRRLLKQLVVEGPYLDVARVAVYGWNPPTLEKEEKSERALHPRAVASLKVVASDEPAVWKRVHDDGYIQL